MQRIVVGVNKFTDKSDEIDIPILNLNEDAGLNQIKQLKILKKKRSQTNVNSILEKITNTCKNSDNLMPF